MNRPDLKSARECFADYLDSIGMSADDKAALLEIAFHDEADRINRYVDSCPRPLAGGGYKNTLTGEYQDADYPAGETDSLGNKL